MAGIQFDFGSGRADPGTFPTKKLQEAAVKVIAEEAEELTKYPGDLGHLGMRQAMARREEERENVSVNLDHLLLTNGSMQAVTLSAEALQEMPGDTVLLEEFNYPGTLGAYRSLKLEMVGIKLDEGGMRLDHMEDELKRLDKAKKLPKFIYAISTYQNPTGFNMPKSRRLEMIELARRYDIPIVEDNCYADVHYEGEIEPAIYALDDDPNHIYLCSLSKILGPGLRLGYLIARPPMLEKILAGDIFNKLNKTPKLLTKIILKTKNGKEFKSYKESVELIKEIDKKLTYILPNHLVGIIWKGKFKGQKQKWFVMRFIGNESEININTKHPEFLDWKWIDLDDLTKIAVNFKLDVYKNVKYEVKKILN